MNQPDIAAKLCDEITTQVGTRAPSHDDFKTMEYLNGCVHETLRLHPSVPGDHKEAVKDDTLPDGIPYPVHYVFHNDAPHIINGIPLLTI
jgi:cytochrome P450